MATRFKLNLPPVFNQAKFSAAASRATTKTGGETVAAIQNAMENSPHTGKVIKRRGRRHQQSRRGQRPAPLSGNLKNSVKLRKVSTNEVVVSVDAEYTERLIKLDRVIISESDQKKAGESLRRNYENELKNLV